jgi:hypothetical protein
MKGSGLENEASQQYSLNNFYWAHDYNYVSNTVEPPRAEGWDAPGDELPDSLYLTEAPGYFAQHGLAWPPVNPYGKTDTERVRGLPARQRYEALTKKR